MQEKITRKDGISTNLRSLVGALALGLFIFTLAYMMIGKLNATATKDLPQVGAKISLLGDFATLTGIEYAQAFNSLVGFCGFIILAIIVLIGLAFMNKGGVMAADEKVAGTPPSPEFCYNELPLWERLNAVPYKPLANYLKNENPQTVGVILAQLAPEQTAKILERFDEYFSLDVMMCMLDTKDIAPEVLANLEKSLQKVFFSESNKTLGKFSFSALFAWLDKGKSKRLLKQLEKADSFAFSKLRAELS